MVRKYTTSIKTTYGTDVQNLNKESGNVSKFVKDVKQDARSYYFEREVHIRDVNEKS